MEMIVGVFIFSIIMVAATGATLSIVSANKQAEAIKSVVSNFSYALDSMTRNLRVGTEYRCFRGGSEVSGGCRFGPSANAGGDEVRFTDSNGLESRYKLSGTTLQRYAGTGYFDITSSDVKIDHLRFYVRGLGDDNEQPNVLIVVKGHVDFKDKQTNFTVETLATQRKVDSDETSI